MKMRLSPFHKYADGTFHGAGRLQSMSQFAQILENYVRARVIDRTGLTGNFDFRIVFSGEGLPSTTFSATSSEPSSSPLLDVALRTQMGLNLTQSNTPIDALVVDHCEKAPVEN
jgi:uncharacterized protein (TIGR03435 family)